jgi:hypothetical protein
MFGTAKHHDRSTNPLIHKNFLDVESETVGSKVLDGEKWANRRLLLKLQHKSKSHLLGKSFSRSSVTTSGIGGKEQYSQRSLGLEKKEGQR